MLYEIVNPSDAVCFEAPDLQLAACVVLMLGQGHYAAEPQDGEDGVPMFLFGGFDRWWSERWPDEDLADAMVRRRPEVIAGLRSVTYGRFSDVRAMQAILADVPEERRSARLAEWNDARRSSLNDIGGQALRIADRLAAKEAA